VNPFGGSHLDVLDGAPRLAGFDQFGLVQTVDRLGQRVVIRAADRTDRGLDPGLREALAEPDRRVLRSSIRVVDNIFQIENAFLLTRRIGCGSPT